MIAMACKVNYIFTWTLNCGIYLIFLTCFPFVMGKEMERFLEKSAVDPAGFKPETLAHKPSTLYLGHQALGSRD
jgi:hypothetical protein